MKHTDVTGNTCAASLHTSTNPTTTVPYKYTNITRPHRQSMKSDHLTRVFIPKPAKRYSTSTRSTDTASYKNGHHHLHVRGDLLKEARCPLMADTSPINFKCQHTLCTYMAALIVGRTALASWNIRSC